MGGGRKLRASVFAILVVAALVPATAHATPPTLTGVSESAGDAGVLTATWTLPPGMSADYVDVGTTPRTDSAGDFVLSVFTDSLSPSDTTWTASAAVPAGQYFVHVAAYDTAACASGSSSCVDEFSAALPVTVGTPAPPAHPPVLDSVSQADGLLTTNWTLPAGESADFIEVATSPATYAGGAFIVENTVLFDFFLDFGKTSYVATQQLPPGTYYVHVAGLDDTQCPNGFEPACFVDEYSNTLSFTVASSAVPDTSITSGPSGPTNHRDVQFAFASTEPDSSFRCELDGPGAKTGSFEVCTNPASFAGLEDGSYTLSVRAEKNGSVDPTPATRTFEVDTQAPDTAISSGPGRPGDDDVGLAFEASESGATFECRLDGPDARNGSFEPCTSPEAFSDLDNGRYSFYVRATDVAGNTDPTPAVVSFTVGKAKHKHHGKHRHGHHDRNRDHDEG
jgi:hypothetical protein